MQPLLEEQAGFDEYYPHTEDKELTSCLLAINLLFQGAGATNECLLAAETYRMFSLLFDGHYRSASTQTQTKRDVTFMQNVSVYLKQNFANDISTADAAVGFLDYCYFSRAFKKHIGQSPAVYFGKWK